MNHKQTLQILTAQQEIHRERIQCLEEMTTVSESASRATKQMIQYHTEIVQAFESAIDALHRMNVFGVALRFLSCIRCGCDVSGNSPTQKVEANGVVRLRTGSLITPKGGVYCRKCAQDLQMCRVCGCTEEAGCRNGCFWERADTCSECATAEELVKA